MLLETKQLEVGYGKKPVIFDISIKVDTAEIVAIIGHNAAGKTTCMKGIIGLLKPSSGEVVYRGHPITRRPPAANAKDGLAFVASERAVFPDLTVRENLEMGLYTLGKESDVESRLKMAHELFPILRDRERQKARTLSGGEQRMLAIGITLVMRPQLLLLDEPSLGLAPKMIQRLMEVILEIQQTLGTAAFVAEQNVKQILQIAQRVYVIKMGRIILEASGKELLQREQWWDLF